MINEYYTTRDERNEFLSKKFSKYIGRTVLNCGGGGKKYLAKYLDDNIAYKEIDIDGEPDLLIDLENTYPIPMESNSFETVVCTDVLEHLDEFHRTFEEIIRISSGYVIISLPNSLKVLTAYLFLKNYTESSADKNYSQKYFGIHSKYYGLPLQKPLDRHKWFFSITDLENFFHHKNLELNYTIEEEFIVGLRPLNFKQNLFKTFLNLFGKSFVKNILGKSYWVVLKVKND
jgi:predicted SAM-dependent methyltransferase